MGVWLAQTATPMHVSSLPDTLFVGRTIIMVKGGVGGVGEYEMF